MMNMEEHARFSLYFYQGQRQTCCLDCWPYSLAEASVKVILFFSTWAAQRLAKEKRHILLDFQVVVPKYCTTKAVVEAEYFRWEKPERPEDRKAKATTYSLPSMKSVVGCSCCWNWENKSFPTATITWKTVGQCRAGSNVPSLWHLIFRRECILQMRTCQRSIVAILGKMPLDCHKAQRG